MVQLLFQSETLLCEFSKIVDFSFTVSMLLIDISTQFIWRGGNLKNQIGEFSIEIADTGRRSGIDYFVDDF
jgi:hypothetical protein